MYDILQLNDMIVPELLDIAEQLKIPNAKKLDKQDLIYKILDGQALGKNGEEEKRKRKRIIKSAATTATEAALVEAALQYQAAQERGDRSVVKYRT